MTTTEAAPVFHFEDFHLDLAGRKLQHGDEDLALPRRVFNCLVYLVEHRDRVVGRDELIEAVWGTVNLTDNVLTQAVLEARHALGDTGETQQFIQTVRGFGYRWVMPVEVETVGESGGDRRDSPQGEAVTAAPEHRSRRGPVRFPVVAAILAVGVVIGVGLYLRKGDETRPLQASPRLRAQGEIAMLLPVTVEAGSEHAWVRLGVMDLIATRLSEAGQAMVPSDTVIALTRGPLPETGPEELDRLARITGAQLVLGARAQVTGARWTVSLRSLFGSQPPLNAVGEAHDVLEAARTAADRMAIALGLTPADEPSNDSVLQTLLQKIEAARLAQQMDVARGLIEAAHPRLRRHPDVRLQSARVAYYSNDLEAARTIYESLLDETSADRDLVLRAYALNGLGSMHLVLDEPDAARPYLQEAAHLLQGEAPVPGYLGNVQIGLGIVAQARGDFDAARTHFAHARRVFESLGHVQGLAGVELNVGALELWRERYVESLRHFASAAARAAAVQDVLTELRAHSNMIEAHLRTLELQAAWAIEPRVQELLTQTTNADLTIPANIIRANLLYASGRTREAESLLDEVLGATEGRGVQPRYRMATLLLRAERTMASGEDLGRAVELATEVVGGLEGTAGVYEERARAWLILIRAHLALGDEPAAVKASKAMTAWARRGDAWSPKTYAALAEAELAAVGGRSEAAAAAFERALALARSSHIPLHLLEVAKSYVPWLLGNGPDGSSDPDRALLVVDRVAGYADEHYDAARMQLLLYHALGPVSAWRAALARAKALAGDREIPSELRTAPPPEAR